MYVYLTLLDQKSTCCHEFFNKAMEFKDTVDMIKECKKNNWIIMNDISLTEYEYNALVNENRLTMR